MGAHRRNRDWIKITGIIVGTIGFLVAAFVLFILILIAAEGHPWGLLAGVVGGLMGAIIPRLMWDCIKLIRGK